MQIKDNGPIHDNTDWIRGQAGDWTDRRAKITYPSRSQVLELAVQLARPIRGNIVEFGTWKGYSTRTIRDELWRSSIWDRAQRRKKIFACDSFQGLAEDYEHLAAGTFATQVPKLAGVRIVEGYFDDSLTPALATEVGAVSLAHLDADLYSSTVTALNWLTPLLQPGSLLLFDEFCGEDPAEERAFMEWSATSGVQTAMLAMFGREPSGKGDMSDRRVLFQVVADTPIKKAPPLFPTRLRRKLMANR